MTRYAVTTTMQFVPSKAKDTPLVLRDTSRVAIDSQAVAPKSGIFQEGLTAAQAAEYAALTGIAFTFEGDTVTVACGDAERLAAALKAGHVTLTTGTRGKPRTAAVATLGDVLAAAKAPAKSK